MTFSRGHVTWEGVTALMAVCFKHFSVLLSNTVNIAMTPINKKLFGVFSNLEEDIKGPCDTSVGGLLIYSAASLLTVENCLKSHSTCALGPIITKVIILKRDHSWHY